MTKIILPSERVPIKIWSNEVEPQAVEQLKNIANLPFVFKHVAAMPDVHLGKGATVGSVVATKGAICPAAVGVDIGCGMIALKLNIDKDKVLDRLPALRHSIERSVPVGFESNRRITDSVETWEGWSEWTELSPRAKDLKKKATEQLGTLGGGNHFIEVCLDTESNVWLMLHSGSRNLGKVLAEYHITEAKDLMKQMFIELPDPDLAYLAQGTEAFKAYMKDLNFAQKYAYQNRIEMMNRVLKDVAHLCNNKEPLTYTHCVNCHHNYVANENHYGSNVMVTRKGAVRARIGDLGIIPGSMGTKSYIVEGLGNEESFCSCSHGAGRRMSRSQARKQFTNKDLQSQTEGVECRKDDGVLDEIPSSYKDIDTVMENQKDLVKVVAQLKQVLCVKG